MSNRSSSSFGFPPVVIALVGLSSFVILVAGLRGAAGVIVPVLLAAFVVVIVAPLFFLMQRKGVPSVLALLLLILGLVGTTVAAGAMISGAIKEFNESLPGLEEKIARETARAETWIEERGLPIPDGGLVASLSPSRALSFTGTLVGALGGLLGNLFLILLIAVFMLLEAAILPGKLQEAASLSPGTWERIQEMVDGIRQYVVLKAGMSALTGGLVAVLLLLFDMPFVVLLGLLAFALNFIPTIGSIIAAAPAVVVALVQYDVGTALAVALGYVVINVGVSNVIEPKVFGEGLGLSPLMIVLALVFWGWVFGPIGMLLAIPLTMAMKIVLETADETRWLAVMLGGRAKAEGGDETAETRSSAA